MGDDLINPGEREMGETIDRTPLSRNQLAQTLSVLFCVVVELAAERPGFVVAENPEGTEIATLLIELPLFAAQHGRPSLQKRPNQPRQVVRLRQKSVVAV